MALWGSESSYIKKSPFYWAVWKIWKSITQNTSLKKQNYHLPKLAMPLSQTIGKRKELPMKGASQGGRVTWDEKSIHWLLASCWCLGERDRMGQRHRDPWDGTAGCLHHVLGSRVVMSTGVRSPVTHSLHNPLNTGDVEWSFVSLMGYAAGTAIQVSPAKGK